MSRHNLYCEIGSYCLDKSNFFWSRIWIKFRRNDFNPMIMYFLTANFHKRKVINGLSQLSKNSAITKADINWHTIIRPRDQWKLLQCGLRTRHFPSFFVPTAGHLTTHVQYTQPDTIRQTDGPLVPMARLVPMEKHPIPMVLLVNMHLIKGT